MSAAQPRTGRLTSLDGLRGVAALMVMLSHVVLLDARIVEATGALVERPVGTPVWWFTSTPLNFFVAGPPAVLVFFALSGLVLTLPVLRRPDFDWVAYYPQRAARLALPALASLALFTVLALTVWALVEAPWSATSRGVIPPFSWQALVTTSDLLQNTQTLNTPLWTLPYELVFSFMLPLFVVAAFVFRRQWWLVVLGCVALSILGTLVDAQGFQYFPLFMLGVVIATHFDVIRTWTQSPAHARTVRWGGLLLLIVSVLTMTLPATLWGLFPGRLRLQEWADSVTFLGSAGLVLVCTFWAPLGRVLSTVVFRWLGRVSFSLYLTHSPVLITVDALVGPHHGWVKLLIGIGASLVVAELFCRLVEVPLHRASRKIGMLASHSWQHRLA